MKEQLVKKGILPPSSIVRIPRPLRSDEGEKNLEKAVLACQEGLSQTQAANKFKVISYLNKFLSFCY